MRKLFKSILLSAVMVCSTTSLYAGSGHDHSGHGHNHAHKNISKAEAERIAEKKLAVLVDAQKIPKSWAKLAVLDVKKKQFKYSKEWLIRFQNTKITNKEEQIIYIFVNLYGEVTGANYTGN